MTITLNSNPIVILAVGAGVIFFAYMLFRAISSALFKSYFFEKLRYNCTIHNCKGGCQNETQTHEE